MATWISISHIPVSAAIIYDGVVIDVLSMRLVQLSIIFWACLISAFVATQVSAPYVSIGIRHVWTSFHIVDISMLWNSSFPTRLKMVWIAASVFPFILFRWDSRFPLLFIVIPRYLYVSVLSSISFPSFISGGGAVFPMISSWLFSFPNWMWNLLAMSFVVSSIFWISSFSWWMSTTSSIHRRHPRVV